MNRNKIASELVAVAKELVGATGDDALYTLRDVGKLVDAVDRALTWGEMEDDVRESLTEALNTISEGYKNRRSKDELIVSAGYVKGILKKAIRGIDSRGARFVKGALAILDHPLSW